MMRMKLGWIAAVTGVVALIGCGGSQSGSFGGSSGWTGGAGLNNRGPMQQQQPRPGQPGSTGPQGADIPTAGGLPVFLTDTSEPQVEHAYVRIYDVSLFTSKNSIPIFSSNEGQVVDLLTLKDSLGPRYLFLGSTTTTPADAVRVQLVVGKDFVIVPKGQTESEVRQFADSLNEGKNKTRLALQLTKRDAPALVLNFDLGAATDDQKKKTLVVLKEGDASLIADMSRQDVAMFTGKAANVTGQLPSINFGIPLGNGRVVRVETTDQTAVFDSKGDAVQRVTNGAQVDVRGRFDVTTKMFQAASLRVIGKGSAGDAVTGTLKTDALEQGKLVLTAASTTGSARSAHALTLEPRPTAVYLLANGEKTGKEDFLKAVKPGVVVEADGAFDKKGDLMQVDRLKIRSSAAVARSQPKPSERTPDGDKPSEAAPNGESQSDGPRLNGGAATSEAIGVVSSIDKAAGSFSIKTLRATGFKSEAENLPIILNDMTGYRDIAGKKISKEQMLEALAEGARVRIRGGLQTGGFGATLIMLMRNE